MNTKAIFAALAIAALVFVGFAVATRESGPAAPIQLYSTNGKLFDSESKRGSVIVVDFFATWCPPCRAALPGLQRLHERYADKNVSVVSIQVSDNQSPEQLMQQLGVKYPVLIAGDQVAQDYNVKSLPTLIVISKSGQVVHRSTGWGSRSESEVASAIEDALAAE